MYLRHKGVGIPSAKGRLISTQRRKVGGSRQPDDIGVPQGVEPNPGGLIAAVAP